MDSSAFELLSPRERDCLRLLSRDREPHEIAAELGITPGTLANHIKSARAKLGGITRYQAARELREYEAALPGARRTGQGMEPIPSEDSPAKDMSDLADLMTSTDRRPMVGAMSVREERATFTFEEPRLTDRFGNASQQMSGLQTVVLIAALVVLIGAFASLAYPLSEGAQRLANLIANPKPH
jgi:DNA-binding CsgD family transcriptional regulator